jgi:RING finger protein 26
MRPMTKAAAYDQVEEGLVRSAVAKSSVHLQEQQQSSMKLPLSGTSLSALAPAENETATCIVCLAAPRTALLIPCKHMVMCAECTITILASTSSQPQCPVCRSRIADCFCGVFL